MARLKRGVKTKAARDYIAVNPTASPKEIVAGLAATGMKIKLGLANGVKYGKRRPGRRKARTVASAARKTHASNGAVSVAQLIELKRLADSIGGIEHVRTALETLEMRLIRLKRTLSDEVHRSSDGRIRCHGNRRLGV
jgi:hypothetical protein